jgi:hypothetical protein
MHTIKKKNKDEKRKATLDKFLVAAAHTTTKDNIRSPHSSKATPPKRK